MAGMQAQGKACIVELGFLFAFYVLNSTLRYSERTHSLRMTSFKWESGKKTTRSDKDFRKAVRNKTFYGKETAQSLLLTNCTFIHFTKPNLDASEAAWHHRAISQNIAENKVQSANRCPWQIQGEIMGYWIRTMTQHSATLRPDFSKIIYPTYVPMAPANFKDVLAFFRAIFVSLFEP